MEIILAIATLLGGITAAWFIWEKISIRLSSRKTNDPGIGYNTSVSDKLIDNEFWESSQLKSELESKGFSFRWCNQDKIESRLSSGYQFILYTDKNDSKSYRLLNKSGQILIGRAST